MIVPRGEKSTTKAQLYLDNSPESRKAKQLLDESGIDHDAWVEGEHFSVGSGLVAPKLNAREGHYQGLKAIEGYIMFKTKHQGDKS